MGTARTNHFFLDAIQGARVIAICGVVVALLFFIPAAEFQFNAASVEGTVVRIIGDATSAQPKAVIGFVDVDGVEQVFTNVNAGVLRKGQPVEVMYRTGKPSDARANSPWVTPVVILAIASAGVAFCTVVIRLFKPV